MAKRLYYNGLITNCKNKIETTRNIAKSVTGKNLVNKLPLSVCINGALTENQQVIADSFQSHCLDNVGSLTSHNPIGLQGLLRDSFTFFYLIDKLVSNNIEDIHDINCKDYLHRIFKNPYPNLIFDRTMTKEIENIIKSLKSKNSCGYDKISVKILKVNSPFITAPLNYICNRSILSGSFPTCLKYSVVKPLFKKGDKNYRPILLAFSQKFEKVIYIRLSKHIKKMIHYLLINMGLEVILQLKKLCLNFLITFFLP
jgi:hypothetical protein